MLDVLLQATCIWLNPNWKHWV